MNRRPAYFAALSIAAAAAHVGYTISVSAQQAPALRGRLVYDLNRYNDRSFKEDQTEMGRKTLDLTVAVERVRAR
jgi:hypothetical protein